jgi:predicted RecA/RadA family phage recombinase
MSNVLKCRIEDTHHLPPAVVPSPGVSAGDMDLEGTTVFFYLDDYETGEIGVRVIDAERAVLPAASAATFAVGADVFYDDSTKDLNGTAGGRYRCGKCRVAKAALELTVEVDFCGNNAVAV